MRLAPSTVGGISKEMWRLLWGPSYHCNSNGRAASVVWIPIQERIEDFMSKGIRKIVLLVSAVVLAGSPAVSTKLCTAQTIASQESSSKVSVRPTHALLSADAFAPMRQG